MYIAPAVVAQIARSAAPEIVNFVSPVFDQSFITSFLLLMSTISAELSSLWREYNAHTNQKISVAVEAQHFADSIGSANMFLLKSLFDEVGLHSDDCPLKVACEVGTLLSKNNGLNFIYTKFFGNSTEYVCSGSSTQQLFCKFSKMIVNSTINGKGFCEKQNFKCNLDSFDNFISKLKSKSETPTLTMEARDHQTSNFLSYVSEVINSV